MSARIQKVQKTVAQHKQIHLKGSNLRSMSSVKIILDFFRYLQIDDQTSKQIWFQYWKKINLNWHICQPWHCIHCAFRLIKKKFHQAISTSRFFFSKLLKHCEGYLALKISAVFFFDNAKNHCILCVFCNKISTPVRKVCLLYWCYKWTTNLDNLIGSGYYRRKKFFYLGLKWLLNLRYRFSN